MPRYKVKHKARRRGGRGGRERGYYVNAYEVDRSYGGPEEGGWWYNYGEPIECVRVRNKAQEEAVRKRLEKDYAYLGPRKFGRYDRPWLEIHTEKVPGSVFPAYQPHYS